MCDKAEQMVRPMPLLTIITINKNDASGLRRSILSVLPLLGARVAYLVIDGDSSDESCQVARSLLQHVPEAVFVSEPDGGIYPAMNKGWRIATGRYVAFLNSGDELIEDGYRRFLDEVAHEGGDVYYARTYLASERGEIVGIHERHPSRLRSDTLPHLATITKREVLQRLNGFDASFRIVADRDFFIRVKKNGGSFVYCSEVVSVFYMGGVSSGWRAGLESAGLNYKYGHIGWLGWSVRWFWYSLTRFSFAMFEGKLPAESKIRRLIAVCRRVLRR